MVKRLIVTALVGLSALSVACASTLRTRQAAEQIQATVEAVMRNQGYSGVLVSDEGGTWHIRGELRNAYPYREKVYKLTEEPVLRTDPGGNNITVLEERVDPTQATTALRSQEMVFKADVAVPKNGPDRDLQVSVSGPAAVRSDKYREIAWTGDEPPSTRQLEEALTKGIRQLLAD